MSSENMLRQIVEHFQIQSEIESVNPLGAGHINDSFKVTTTDSAADDYVLQRINHNIFKDVDALQNNIFRVTTHIRKKLVDAKVPNPDDRVLRLIPTKDGKLYHQTEDGFYYRLLRFIPDSHSYDSSISIELAEAAGFAFGNFQSQLADLPEPPLAETIPNFHNMESRLADFRQAVKDNAANRLAEVQTFVDEIEKRSEFMCRAEELHRQGKLPKRINHCDTKVNNVLFDGKHDVLCVVDLDTVMPGYVLSDFGDFMRTGANTGLEDDVNLDNVSINLEIFEAYSKGYLRSARSFLTETEIDNLPYGALLLTYMQTVRFLTDYLNGDTYYKVHSPIHNLQRTKAQFKLLQSMEENYEKMKSIIGRLMEK